MKWGYPRWIAPIFSLNIRPAGVLRQYRPRNSRTTSKRITAPIAE
jgi:hypothetical protein